MRNDGGPCRSWFCPPAHMLRGMRRREPAGEHLYQLPALSRHRETPVEREDWGSGSGAHGWGFLLLPIRRFFCWPHGGLPGPCGDRGRHTYVCMYASMTSTSHGGGGHHPPGAGRGVSKRGIVLLLIGCCLLGAVIYEVYDLHGRLTRMQMDVAETLRRAPQQGWLACCDV